MLISNEIKVWKRAAFNLPLMLLTVSHQEKHKIEVRSGTGKMLYNARDVCTMFNSSKSVSNKWWASLIKQAELLLKQGLQVLHIRVSLPYEWQSYLLSGSWSSPPSSKLYCYLGRSGTEWELCRSCQKRLYVNDSMSDNSKVNRCHLSLLTEWQPFSPHF